MSSLTRARGCRLAEKSASGRILAAMLAALWGRRRPRHRIASLQPRLLRDIGYTRHGIREAALDARNEGFCR